MRIILQIKSESFLGYTLELSKRHVQKAGPQLTLTPLYQ